MAHILLTEVPGACWQVCKVYDSAELCRNVHSSPAWRAAAAKAVLGLGGEAVVSILDPVSHPEAMPAAVLAHAKLAATLHGQFKLPYSIIACLAGCSHLLASRPQGRQDTCCIAMHYNACSLPVCKC